MKRLFSHLFLFAISIYPITIGLRILTVLYIGTEV